MFFHTVYKTLAELSFVLSQSTRLKDGRTDSFLTAGPPAFHAAWLNMTYKWVHWTDLGRIRIRTNIKLVCFEIWTSGYAMLIVHRFQARLHM